jgi:xanthine/uracil/vitamin C permease (AzgA family)
MTESSRQGGASHDGAKSAGRSGAARLFDIRLVIGALLTVYGVILTITGIADNNAAVQKAAGLRINLWTGLGLLVVGAFFLVWVKLAPLQAVKADDAEEMDTPARGS